MVQQWNWYIEYSNPHQGYLHAVKEYHYSGKTAFQRVDIVDMFTYGRCLILDGKIQSAEFDEYIYHEALIHPAMILHPEAKRVMIMGGGEGAVLRELLRHPVVEKVVMVDIDREVVELCKKYLGRWHAGSFDDPRVELLHMDARLYLEENTERFDIIYSDLTEPDSAGPSHPLFTRQFYCMAAERLAPGGILALQAGGFSPDYMNVHAAMRNTLRRCFPRVCSYHAFIPSFDCSWGFILAAGETASLDAGCETVDSRLGGIASQLRFYDGETHEMMFRLPKNMRAALSANKTVLEDGSPLTIY